MTDDDDDDEADIMEISNCERSMFTVSIVMIVLNGVCVARYVSCSSMCIHDVQKRILVFTFVMLWQKWTDFNNFCKFYDKKDYDMHLRSLITNCWSMKTLRRSFYSIGLQFIQPNFRSTPSLCEICWSAFDLMLGGAPYRKTAVLHAVQQNSVCWCRILRSYCQLQIYQRN